ncbi:MAG: steroid 3-ketoacyl-CoA thiolase, partial [Achromobacter pestifer]
MNEAVILEAVRTPFGRRGGWWADTRPDTLLAQTVRAMLARAGLPGGKIEDVIAGCVSQAGEQGANIGRLVAMLADLPETVPGVAVNRMCGSSQQAVHF